MFLLKKKIGTLLMLGMIIFSSCNFIASIKNQSKDENIEIESLTLNKDSLKLSVGEMGYLSIKILPANVQKNVKLEWTYDSNIITCDTSSVWGVTIQGLKEGQTNLKCSYNGYDANCLITIEGFAANYEETIEPYIYSNTSIMQISPGITERVFCSLYGGNANDIDGYSWTTDNTDVINIEPTGQYCLVTAKNSGYARIKINHVKATYPYYMGIYVFEDATNICYITTTNNILTMNDDDPEQNISVSLVNGKATSLDNQFKWELINEDDEVPINFDINCNNAVIKPENPGTCTLRVTHPDASYPLDILCRVITIVENVYIKPDTTVVNINGEEEKLITSTLENIEEGDYDLSEYNYILDDYSVAEIVGFAGNEVVLKGKANGSCKLIISHPKAAYSREVLVIVNEQISNALDSTFYITTSQNYIRTKVGEEEIKINISLKGGTDGDEADFKWSIKSTTKDGSEKDVVSMSTIHGDVNYSRAAYSTYAVGEAFIEPIYEGTAVITITHPKVVYPTEILVKVLSEEAILSEPLYFTGEGIVKIVNGTSTEYSVQLKGFNKTTSDDNNIEWNCDNDLLNIISSGNIVEITAPELGSGNTISNLIISHPKADVEKKVLILTADSEDELDNIKALYSDKLYYNIGLGDTVYCSTESVGFYYTEIATDIDEDGNEYEYEKKIYYDLSSAIWTLSDSSICSIEKLENNPLTCKVTALKTGTTRLTVTVKDDECNEYKCEYTITVYPDDAVHTEPEIYFTTATNVVNFQINDIKTVLVDVINLSSSEFKNITWSISDPSVCNILPNGNSAILTGLSEGETIIKVEHPLSQNILKIYVRVGSEYITDYSIATYIKSPNLLALTLEDKSQLLTASLENYNGTDKGEFLFTVKDTDIINISAQSTSGTAYIKPISSGITEIIISNTLIGIRKQVLVIVANDNDELNDLLGNTVYLTSNKNVIEFESINSFIDVSVNLMNVSENNISDIQWTSSDTTIVDILVNNGKSATLHSLNNGYAYVDVTYPTSVNSLRFYVLVGEEAIESGIESDNTEIISGSKSTYIKAPDVITILMNDENYLLNASIENYEGSNINTNFNFSITDESIAAIVTQSENGNAYIKPISVGYTEITITHSGLDINKNVLVVVGNNEEEISQMLDALIYFSIETNTLFLEQNERTNISVKANNLTDDLCENILWQVDNNLIVDVIGNGKNATVIAYNEGSTKIKCSHPNSVNTLEIYVYVAKNETSYNDEVNNLSVTYISSTDIISMLKDDNIQRLDAVLVNYNNVDTSGFEFTIDNEKIATITSQSTNGIAYIKPISSGQAEITITHPMSSIEKKVLVIVGNSAEELAGYTYLTTNSNVVAIGEGTTKSVSVSVKNTSDIIIDGYSWSSSDPSIVDVIATGSTAVLKGNEIGTAIITVKNSNCTYPLQIIAQCVDPIAASSNPYIQLSSSVLTIPIGNTYNTITADLVGGTEADFSDFNWTSSNSNICVVYGQNEIGKIKAMSAGMAEISVSHPKANYTAKILVICDEVEETECYISVPQSIISMKPTDSAQTITASLINGSTTDKYNFTWSLDVYDVIDFVYSANICTITPLQSGQVTITIHHPKAAYDQQIVVTVQEYNTFAFPEEYLTITKGNVKFLTMQIPNTTVSTYVEYSTRDETKCKIEGTKTTAQITAIGTGTTTVIAKLIASSSQVVQATAEMMIYVEEADVDTCYITSGSTIYTLNKNKSMTLTASITGNGITTGDQANLKWTTNDTDIISIVGINSSGVVSGQSVYITALTPGEALITCSHEKAESVLQFYVLVPGSVEKSVSLNKSYITLIKGNSGSTIQGTIENAESSSDYNSLIWSVENPGDTEICRIMGNKSGDDIIGNSVTIYPVSVGTATVVARLADSDIYASCTVTVEAGKSLIFENTSVKVQPFGTKRLKYTVSPSDAILTWTMTQEDDYFTFIPEPCDENGVGYVTIEGCKEGRGNIYCTTDSGAKATLQINVAWDYLFSLKKTTVKCKPSETTSVDYNVNPVNAELNIESTYSDNFDWEYVNNGDGSGKITFTPIKENPNLEIVVTAINPINNNIIGSKTLRASFCYEDSDIIPEIKYLYSDGKFSSYDSVNQILYLGDGETVKFSVDVNIPKANACINDVSFNSTGDVKISSYDTETKTFTISSPDIIDTVYYINKAWKPVYYPEYWTLDTVGEDEDGEPIEEYDDREANAKEITDWKESFYYKQDKDLYKSDDDRYLIYNGLLHREYSKIGGENGIDYRYWKSLDVDTFEKDWEWVLFNCSASGSGMTAHKQVEYSSSWGLKENPEEIGKEYLVDEFEDIAWYYIPSGLYLPEGVITRHVDAIKQNSLNDSCVPKDLGSIKLDILHNGVGVNQNSNLQIKVILQTRKCNKTCTASDD